MQAAPRCKQKTMYRQKEQCVSQSKIKRRGFGPGLPALIPQACSVGATEPTSGLGKEAKHTPKSPLSWERASPRRFSGEVWSFSKVLPPHYHRKEVTKLEKGLNRVGGREPQKGGAGRGEPAGAVKMAGPPLVTEKPLPFFSKSPPSCLSLCISHPRSPSLLFLPCS